MDSVKREALFEYYVDQLHTKFGYITPKEVYSLVVFCIKKIVIEDKPWKYIDAVIKNNKYIKRKQRGDVKRMVKAVFPADYFIKKSRKEFVKKHPQYIGMKIENNRQINMFRQKAREC